MQWTRREFLGLTAALGLPSAPSLFLRAAESAGRDGGDSVLVVLQLSGGNDGLNTVIPFEEKAYLDSRPTLAIRKGDALPLGEAGAGGAASANHGGPGADSLGFHPRMPALQKLYREGKIAIVQGVGYPNPSRSHFRSMDIWHTARPDREDLARGWLGDVFSRHRDSVRGLNVGEEKLPLALQGEVQIPTLQNLDWVDYLATSRGADLRARLHRLHARSRDGQVEQVRSLASATLSELERIIELRNRPVPVVYPDFRLAQKLKWVGQLIGGGFPSRVYYLTLGGFDTHAQQKDGHAYLMGELSDSLAAFQRHLEALKASTRVNTLVFSEFGRRVKENGSLGTDHGCAAPLFLVSEMVRGGLYGAHPRFDNLDDGDLRFGIDFRRVYATVLQRVLKVDPEPVLGGRFESLQLYSRQSRV